MIKTNKQNIHINNERNNTAHTTDGDVIAVMYEYLEQGRWHNFVIRFFPMVFRRGIADWENATEEEISRKMINCRCIVMVLLVSMANVSVVASNYELEQLPVMEAKE
jgi:hypothetical protein